MVRGCAGRMYPVNNKLVCYGAELPAPFYLALTYSLRSSPLTFACFLTDSACRLADVLTFGIFLPLVADGVFGVVQFLIYFPHAARSRSDALKSMAFFILLTTKFSHLEFLCLMQAFAW